MTITKNTLAAVAAAGVFAGIGALAGIQSLTDTFSSTSKITIEIDGPLSPEKISEVQSGLTNVLELSKKEIDAGETGLKINGHSNENGTTVIGNNGAFSGTLKEGNPLRISW